MPDKLPDPDSPKVDVRDLRRRVDAIEQLIKELDLMLTAARDAIERMFRKKP